MSFENWFDLFFCDVLSKFGERLLKLRRRNLSRIVYVKLMEKTFDHRLIVDRTWVDCSCNELGVAHGFWLVHIKFFKNAYDLIFLELNCTRRLTQGSLELIFIYGATLVGIHPIENCSEFRKGTLGHLLNQELNGRLFKLASSVERSKALHNGVLNRFINMRTLMSILEPGMVHCFNDCNSFLGILVEHSFYQILQILTKLFWHLKIFFFYSIKENS